MAGGKGDRLQPLTRERSKSAVPFGGRHRLIDFVLSNFMVDVPIAEVGIGAAQSYRVHEVVSDQWYDWRGARNYVELDPTLEPAQVFVLHR